MTERDLRLIVSFARMKNIDLSVSEIFKLKRLHSTCDSNETIYSGFTNKGTPILVVIHTDENSVTHVLFE